MRVFQEVHNFFDLFLRLVAASHISKRDLVGVFVEHAGFAFAKTERTTLATALHLAHEVDPYADQQQHWPPADQQRHQEGTLFARLHVELDLVLNEITHESAIQHGSIGADLSIIGGGGDDFAAAQSLRDDGALDTVIANFIQKFGIAHRRRTGAASGIKLFEYREQHHGDDQPHGKFRKPLIVQAELQLQGRRMARCQYGSSFG